MLYRANRFVSMYEKKRKLNQKHFSKMRHKVNLPGLVCLFFFNWLIHPRTYLTYLTYLTYTTYLTTLPYLTLPTLPYYTI